MDQQAFIAPQAFEGCLDGHATDVFHGRKRQNEYHADVARENEERRRRSQELLNPDLPETRERWNGTQTASHEGLFPCSDNLTTLMFVVASDLSEAQRERLKSSLSLQEVEVTAYTLEAARTVFVDLFCTPKSSMENPSLRVNQYGIRAEPSSWKDFIEDEFEQWSMDEVTGEQGYVDDEGSCFLDMGQERVCLAVQIIQDPKTKEESWRSR